MYKQQANPAVLMVEPSTADLERSLPTSEIASVYPTSTPTLTAAIVGADPVGCSTLRQMLRQSGWIREVQEWASAKSVELRSAQDVPDLIFLELSDESENDFTFSQQLMRLRPSVHIAACSANPHTNPEFLLRAMRSGVRDFLQKPYDRIDVAAILARVNSAQGSETPNRSQAGKLLVVLGTKGGVGTSTVAVNLAVQLSQIPGKSAVLLDFSRPLGDITGLLDLKAKFQLADALDNFKRLDATLLKGLLTPHASGLQVLAGAAQLEDWQRAPFAAVERIVEIAQGAFDFVVMDLGAFYAAEWQSVLQASEVLLISEADLPGLAKLHRHLGALANLRVSSTQIRLIINRWHRHDEEALKKIEHDMKTPVFARLPNNFKQVSDATLRGKAIGKGSDALSCGYSDIANRLAGVKTEKETKKAKLGGFFSF